MLTPCSLYGISLRAMLNIIQVWMLILHSAHQTPYVVFTLITSS